MVPFGSNMITWEARSTATDLSGEAQFRNQNFLTYRDFSSSTQSTTDLSGETQFRNQNFLTYRDSSSSTQSSLVSVTNHKRCLQEADPPQRPFKLAKYTGQNDLYNPRCQNFLAYRDSLSSTQHSLASATSHKRRLEEADPSPRPPPKEAARYFPKLTDSQRCQTTQDLPFPISPVPWAANYKDINHIDELILNLDNLNVQMGLLSSDDEADLPNIDDNAEFDMREVDDDVAGFHLLEIDDNWTKSAVPEVVYDDEDGSYLLDYTESDETEVDDDYTESDETEVDDDDAESDVLEEDDDVL